MEPALSAAKEPALRAAKEPALSLSKEPALSAAKEPALSAAKESALRAAKESALRVAKEPALSGAKGRHLTVTGFVVHEGRVALHWHRKIQAWLPAGGHIEPGEDPVQAVLREVREEFDLEAGIVPLAPRVAYEGGPRQIEPPFAVLLCPIEPGHEHIDLVYFLRVVSGYPGRSHDPDSPITWVDETTLRTEDGLPLAGECGPTMPFPPDVRALALEAIRLAGTHDAAHSASPPLRRAERGPGGEVC